MNSKKTVIKNVLIYAILAVLIACFLSIYNYVIQNDGIYNFTKIDRAVYDYVFNNLNTFEKFFLVITNFGKVFIIYGSIIFIIIALILIKFINIKNLKLYLINVLTPGAVALTTYLLNDVLKNAVGRLRPMCIHLVKEDSFSFPSGHSSTSAAFYFIVLVIVTNLINRYIGENKNIDNRKIILLKILKIFLIIICSIFPFIIALSRVYLGVHYFTDVVCGLIFGSIMYILFYKIYKRITKNI